MRKVQIKMKLYMQISTMILCVVALTTLYSVNAFAKSEKNAVVGKVYEFDKNNDYDISESDTFCISFSLQDFLYVSNCMESSLKKGK